jgi:hypothetical protein
MKKYNFFSRSCVQIEAETKEDAILIYERGQFFGEDIELDEDYTCRESDDDE